MEGRSARRALGGVAAIALAGLVAACASQPQQQSYQPPPPAPLPAYGSSAPAAIYSVTAPLHLRAAPTVGAAIIGTLPPGSRVEALGPPQEGVWLQVRTPEGTGWVNDRYLAPS